MTTDGDARTSCSCSTPDDTTPDEDVVPRAPADPAEQLDGLGRGRARSAICSKVNTHLYVDRAHFRATLKRNGKTCSRRIVGVGRAIWPTPRGEFYIRDKLTNFNNAFYGPIAFGTSARSATLTDWPGGGFVGVHGTNEPGDPAGPRLARLHPDAERRRS